MILDLHFFAHQHALAARPRRLPPSSAPTRLLLLILCTPITLLCQGYITKIPERMLWDSTQLVDDLKSRAWRGDPDAQCRLADMIVKGGPSRWPEAVELYRKAANHGFAEGQFSLGTHYAFGRGVEKDLAEAFRLYQLAANQGYAKAQYALGLCYVRGDGTAQNIDQAVMWYRSAAEQRHEAAEHDLGICYAKGMGVPQDFTQAVGWFRRAANHGLPHSQFNLGLCYDTGKGVSKNPTKAVTWYRKAAEQGHAVAQLNLAVSYFNGTGIPQDSTEAYVWYSLSASFGGPDNPAIPYRLEVAKRLSPNALAKADARIEKLRLRIQSTIENQ